MRLAKNAATKTQKILASDTQHRLKQSIYVTIMHQASTHTTRTSTWRDERAHALPHSTTEATYAKATYAKLRSDDWRAPERVRRLQRHGRVGEGEVATDDPSLRLGRGDRSQIPVRVPPRHTQVLQSPDTGAVLQSPDRCGVSASRAMMRGARLVPCLVRCRLVCGAAIRAHALLPYSLHLLQLRLLPSPLEHHRLAPLLAVLEEALRRRGLNQSH